LVWPESITPHQAGTAQIMTTKIKSMRLSALLSAGLALAAFSGQAQNNVNVTGTLTYVAGTRGVFNYTLTLSNVGPESVSSLWLGWTVGVFDIANPTAASSSLAWSAAAVSDSIQYGPGTPLAAGDTAQFTFDSTSTPAQFMAGTAGPSVVYGINATPFAIENTTPNSEEFTPTVVSPANTNLAILVQPKSQSALTNTTVTFSVVATNATAYQWQSNTVAISGQTAASLTISNLVASDAATYRVVVSDASTSITSSNAVLTVTTLPSATKEKLALTVNPAKSGTVTPNLNGQTLTVGHSYTVTAVPGKGQAFANWSGIVQSSDASLTFVMPAISDATLTANFMPSPFASNGVAGSYAGLFWDTNYLANASSGGFSATLSENGVVDGQVKIAGATTSFAGLLGANGSATITVPRSKEDSLVLTLQVDLSGSGTLTGTVADASNTFSAALTAYRAAFSTAASATAYEGSYTWAIPAHSGIAPAGNSFGTATIAPTGGAKLSLTLGDGTTTSAAGALSKDGLLPLYVSLYKGQGSLLAWVSFSKSGVSTNAAYWFKDALTLFNVDASGNPVPVTVAAGPYPDGFTLTNLWLYTAPFNAAGKGSNALDASSVAIQFSGADLTNSITATIALNSAGVGGSNGGIAVNVSDKTGLLSGSFKDPVSGKAVHYQGAVLQPWQSAYGSFVSGGLSGAVVIEPTSALLPVPGENQQVSPDFNQAGNILIADQWNNRVIEVNTSGGIIWSFGLGPNDFSSNSPISVNDAERVGDYTLMANPGDAPGVIPQAPTNGAVDNRVLLVDPTGQVVWQYGQFGQTGSGSNLLNVPVQATFVPDFNVLITDQGNNRIIEVNYDKEIIWQFPGADTNAADQLNAPNSAELLANGHILIADQGNNRALEVTSGGEIVKTFSAGATVNTLAFASRLANGDTLITDAGNARIVEVNAEDHVVWQYYTTNNAPNAPAGSASVASPQPTRAIRLANGDTLISDQLNNRVIRVNKAEKIVADYGLPLPQDGSTFSGGSAGILIGDNFGYGLYSTQAGMYSPYDAKVIGDYTGLTPPLAK
jgi:hypothetical protein